MEVSRCKKTSAVAAVALAFCAFFPSPVFAESLEVSGWIPYWSGTKGPKDAQKHLTALGDIHPFGYSIKSDGTLHDLMGIEKGGWKKLVESAREKGVLVTPTVMASDGALIDSLLSDSEKRAKHVKEIAEMVKDGTFDGVNIDYEGKLAQTKKYFSLFLKELKAAIGDKRLSCAIEPRTPPDSLYKTIPKNLEYANDYAAIGTYCDAVEIMGYDQQRADIKLNDARRGTPYLPVADVDWVRKVVELAAASIPKEKLVLGVPTYGTEYTVTVSPDWYQNYTRVRAVNPDTAEALAKKNKAKPSRNSAGELGFTYATKSVAKKIKKYDAPEGTSLGNTVAAQALAYANATGKTITFNMLSWSDADAIEQKVKLAEEFGLRGIAIFKIDGSEDADLWNILKAYK
jgi:spore germination protein YaaH